MSFTALRIADSNFAAFTFPPFSTTDFGPRTSPATTIRCVVTSVSHATRAYGSAPRNMSTTVSEIRSATLSGCPSDTDSLVNTKSPLRMHLSLNAPGLWRGAAGGAGYLFFVGFLLGPRPSGARHRVRTQPQR